MVDGPEALFLQRLRRPHKWEQKSRGGQKRIEPTSLKNVLFGFGILIN